MTGRHKQNKWRTYIYAKYNSPLSTLTKHLETTRCNHTAFRPVFHSPFNPISSAVGSEVIVKTKQTQLDSFKNKNQEQKPKDKKQDGNVTFSFPPLLYAQSTGIAILHIISSLFLLPLFPFCPSLFSALAVYIKFSEMYTKTRQAD